MDSKAYIAIRATYITYYRRLHTLSDYTWAHKRYIGIRNYEYSGSILRVWVHRIDNPSKWSSFDIGAIHLYMDENKLCSKAYYKRYNELLLGHTYNHQSHVENGLRHIAYVEAPE